MHTYAMFSGGRGSGIYVSRDGGDDLEAARGARPAQAPGRQDRRRHRRQRTRSASTPSSRRPTRARSGARTTAGRTGRSGAGSGPSSAAPATTSGWPSRRPTRTRSSSPTAASTSRPTAASPSATLAWGGDTHDIWIDPTNADRILVTDDGGMYMTADHGKTSRRVTLPIGQMYHVAVDNDVPYRIYSNMQDDGTMRGLSTTPGGRARRGGGRRGGRLRPRRGHGRRRLGPRPRRLRDRASPSPTPPTRTSSGRPATATR